MDAETFCKHAELNQVIADYVDQVAQSTDPEQANRTILFDSLFAVAVYALFRLAKNYFDNQRGLNEAILRQMMLDQVDGLVQNGWSKDKALLAVKVISKDVATLRPDSPVLKAALDLLTKDADSAESK